MDSQRPYIMIGTPAFGGQLTSLYATSVLGFQSYCLAKNEVDFNVTVQWGDSLITRARQDVVTRFLDTPQATHLLFVDGDIGFAPEQVFRLLNFDADFVAGVYPYKKLEMGEIRRPFPGGASPVGGRIPFLHLRGGGPGQGRD